MPKHYDVAKGSLTETQIACQTQYTKTGQRSMKNGKPFRTKVQKVEAKRLAYKVDGRWVSTAPVTYNR